jgi:hypothetical protein
MIEQDSIFVFDNWDAFVSYVGQAQENGDWQELHEYLRTGYMAITVNGLPRLIEGTIH